MNTFTLSIIPFIHHIPDVPKSYPIRNVVLLFFIFSFIGYVWEIIYTAVTEKVVANRGMLYGPWLPVYGGCGIFIILVLSKFHTSPPAVFLLAMIVCGCAEYVTGMLIEHFFKCRWWDYDSKRINLHGRVCLSGILLFGVLGVLGVYVIGPFLNAEISKLTFSMHIVLIFVL